MMKMVDIEEMMKMVDKEEISKLVSKLKAEIYEVRDEAFKHGQRIRIEIVNLLDDIAERIVDQGYIFYEHDNRFFSFITPLTEKKEIPRVLRKLKDTISYLRTNENWEDAKNDPWPIYVPDLARFRIVCCYLSDVYFLAYRIGNTFKAYFPRKERSLKDYIFGQDPDRRPNASKSIHFRFLVNGEFCIELQLLTLLHLGWDQIEHPHYEEKREGKKDIRTDLQFWAASDALYLLDEQLMYLYESKKANGRQMKKLLNDWNQLVDSIVK